MKKINLLLLVQVLALSISAQPFKVGDKVEIDMLMSSSREGSWQSATVTHFDAANNMYTVKLANGNEMGILSRNPEKWIRASTKQQSPGGNTGEPGAIGGVMYENREDILNAPDCNPSEAYIKKMIKAQLARDQYKDYPHIAVDFTSFKGQHGYDDKKYPNQVVYPFKIEMLVYVKRKVMQDGKEYTEYRTWEFDRVYEYATRPERKCEFYAVPAADSKLISSELRLVR